MRRDFERADLPLDRFGWASVQLDGGINRVIGRVQQWFATRPAFPAAGRDVRLGALTIGILAGRPRPRWREPRRARQCRARRWRYVLIPEGDPLVADAGFRGAVLGGTPPRATLVYGEPVATAGFHLVRTDTDHWVENVTGLAACGAHLVVGAVGDGPQQGHPLVAVVQVAGAGAREGPGRGGRRLRRLRREGRHERLVELVLGTARRDVVPAAQAGGFVEFQLTRGLWASRPRCARPRSHATPELRTPLGHRRAGCAAAGDGLGPARA